MSGCTILLTITSELTMILGGEGDRPVGGDGINLGMEI